MTYKLDVPKAIQAVAVLLRSDRHGRMSYLRLLKLLYIADRESVAATGRSLTGDTVVAMKHGPVLSEVFYLVKSKSRHPEAPTWDNYLVRDGYQLQLVNDPGHKKLSRFEVQKLKEIAERYKDHDEWDLVEETHTFPEWLRHNPEEKGVKVLDIPFEDVARAVGRGEDLGWIAEEAAEDARLDRALGRTK